MAVTKNTIVSCTVVRNCVLLVASCPNYVYFFNLCVRNIPSLGKEFLVLISCWTGTKHLVARSGKFYRRFTGRVQMGKSLCRHWWEGSANTTVPSVLPNIKYQVILTSLMKKNSNSKRWKLN